jgi:hypothetical protein
MGDAPAATATRAQATKVQLVVRADAHVDIAHLTAGKVTKTKPLRVSRGVADDLLERHPYLTERKG